MPLVTPVTGDTIVTAVITPMIAIWLTTLVTVIVVPVTVAFGIAASWLLSKFTFRGRGLLITMIELPFSISPIIAGICYLLLYGRQGYLGGWLAQNDITILFALPGILMVTMFVTTPFVVREVLPLMQAQGGIRERVVQETAARELAWMMWRVVEDGTGARARIPGHEVAGKTGTTQAARDAWFVGFSAEYVTGVWMGYDDNTPLTGVTGGGLPAEIWRETMARVLVVPWSMATMYFSLMWSLL